MLVEVVEFVTEMVETAVVLDWFDEWAGIVGRFEWS